MSKWQRVQWDNEGYVTAPPMLVDYWALMPCLVRFINLDNTVSLGVSSRNRLIGEDSTYTAVYVAQIEYPSFDESEHG